MEPIEFKFFESNENLTIHGQSWILRAQLYYCIHLRYKFFKFFSYFELRANSCRTPTQF